MATLEQTECPECGQIVHYQPQRWKAQVICSNCQQSFAVEAIQAPAVPEAEGTPLPSHLTQQSDAQPPPPSTAEPESSADRFQYRRSKVGGVVWAAVGVVLLAGAVIGGIWGLALLDRNTAENDRIRKKEKREIEAEQKKSFALVGKKGAKLGNIQVNVKLVEFGPLRVKDQSNRVHVSSDSLLQIYIEIRNRNSDAVNYVSWYGNSFESQGKQVVAQLSDQDGTIYNMPVFGDVKGLFGHTAKAKIEKNERVPDCIVFELPPKTSVTDIKELKLTLPMQSFGRNGEMNFKIPQDKIQLVSEENDQ